MASIMIVDLNPVDSEMFFNAELSPEEITAIAGGWSWRRAIGGAIGFALGGPVGAYIGYQIVGSSSSNESGDEIEVITSPSPEECMNLPPGEYCL